MALREVLAELLVDVKGLGSVDAANKELDRYVASVTPAVSAIEKLKVQQQESNELAGRIGREIKKLQKAEGDHSKQLEELRIAQLRAKEAAKEYADEAKRLEGQLKETTQAAGGGAGGTGGLAGALKNVRGIAVAVAAAAAGVAASLVVVRESIAQTVQLGTEVSNLAGALGLSTRALQEWRFMGERAGIEENDLRQGFTDIAAAARDSNESFRQIGVTTRDAAGNLRPMEQILEDTLVALNATENETERMGHAMRLLGEDTGPAFVTLAKLSPQFGELRDRFAELGGGLDDDVIARSAEAGDALQEFRLAMLSLRSVVVADVLPGVTNFARGLATVLGTIADFVRNSSVMETALGALAVAFGILALSMAPVIVPTLAVLAGLGLLFLAVEDVVTAFRGGDSVFGSAVERFLEMHGVTMTFAGAVEWLGIQFENLKAIALNAVASVLEAIDSLPPVLSGGLFEGAGDTAAGLRRLAQDASGAARAGAKNLQANEAARFQERRIELKRGLDERTLEARRAAAEIRDVKIEVNGAQDPEQTARTVRREMQRVLREAADGEPLAEPT